MANTLNKQQWQIWIRSVGGLIVAFALIFVSAGRWDYWQGWLYMALVVLGMAAMWFVLPQDSSLVQERLQPGTGMKGWDKRYFALSTPLYLIAVIIAGLDGGRFGWTGSLPAWAYALGVLLYAVGQMIFLWARYVNDYFSSVARIQLDRGQTVCKKGPYRFVRHPGYVGGILYGLATPLVLGSLWALIPQTIAALLLIWRTAKEDRMLRDELDGYIEYSNETHYRLLPGIW